MYSLLRLMSPFEPARILLPTLYANALVQKPARPGIRRVLWYVIVPTPSSCACFHAEPHTHGDCHVYRRRNSRNGSSHFLDRLVDASSLSALAQPGTRLH